MLDGLLEEYLLRLAGSRMPSTVVRLRCQLRRFLEHLHSHGISHPYEIRWEVLAPFLQLLKEDQRLSRSVLQQNIQVVRGFLRHLVAEGELLFDPLPEELGRGRFTGLPKRVPSEAEVAAALARCSSSALHPLRNRALMELAYGCGLRRMELCGLDLDDIRGNDLRVRGKGGRERLVPLGRAAAEALEAYVGRERPVDARKGSGPDAAALFLSQQGRRIHPNTIGLVFRVQAGAAFAPHQLRHACATHLLAGGCDIRLIAALLGHARLSTTQIYARVHDPDLREMLNKCHPREMRKR